MKIWHWIAMILVAGLLAIAFVIISEVRRLEVEQLSPNLHVLFGAGGNVAVLKTSQGTVVVDSMTLEYQGARIRAKAEELSGAPVVMVINTHYHLDHTHGNPAFEAGTRVVATERTLHHLKTFDAEFFRDNDEGDGE